MAKFICPSCGKELEMIECRVSHFLLYDEKLQRYLWSDTSSLSDPGSYYCTECESYIPYDQIKEVAMEASR